MGIYYICIFIAELVKISVIDHIFVHLDTSSVIISSKNTVWDRWGCGVSGLGIAGVSTDTTQ